MQLIRNSSSQYWHATKIYRWRRATKDHRNIIALFMFTDSSSFFVFRKGILLLCLLEICCLNPL